MASRKSLADINWDAIFGDPKKRPSKEDIRKARFKFDLDAAVNQAVAPQANLGAIDKAALAGDRGAKAARSALDKILDTPRYSEAAKDRARDFYQTGRGDLDPSVLDTVRTAAGDTFSKIFRAIDVPKRAVVASIDEALSAIDPEYDNDASWLDNVLRKDEYGWGDVVQGEIDSHDNAYSRKLNNRLVKDVIGLTGDVALDPLSYAGVGLVKDVVKGSEALEGVAKAAQFASKAKTAEGAAGAAAKSRPVRGTLSKIAGTKGRKALNITREDILLDAARAGRADIVAAGSTARGTGWLKPEWKEALGYRGGIRLGHSGRTLVPWSVTRHIGAPLRGVAKVVEKLPGGARAFNLFGDEKLRILRPLLRNPNVSPERKVSAVLGMEAIEQHRLGQRVIVYRWGRELHDLDQEIARHGVDHDTAMAAIFSQDLAERAAAKETVAAQAPDLVGKVESWWTDMSSKINQWVGTQVLPETLEEAGVPVVLSDTARAFLKDNHFGGKWVEAGRDISKLHGAELRFGGGLTELGSEELADAFGPNVADQLRGVMRELGFNDEPFERDLVKILTKKLYQAARVFGEQRGLRALRDSGALNVDPEVLASAGEHLDEVLDKLMRQTESVTKQATASAAALDAGIKGFKQNLKVLRQAAADAEDAYDLARAARSAGRIPTEAASLAEHSQRFRDTRNEVFNILGRDAEESMKGWEKTGGAWPTKYLDEMARNPEAQRALRTRLRELYGDGPVMVVRRGSQTGEEKGIINGSLHPQWGGSGGARVRTYAVRIDDIVGIGSSGEKEVFFRADKALTSKESTVKELSDDAIGRLRREMLAANQAKLDAVKKLRFLEQQTGQSTERLEKRLGSVQAVLRDSLVSDTDGTVPEVVRQTRAKFSQAAEAARVFSAPDDAARALEQRADQVERALIETSPRNVVKRQVLLDAERERGIAAQYMDIINNTPNLSQADRYSFSLAATAHESAAQLGEQGHRVLTDNEMIRFLDTTAGHGVFKDQMRHLEWFGSDFEKADSTVVQAMMHADRIVKDPEDYHWFMKGYKAMVRGFRTFAVLTPGFPVRNSMSAYFMNYADNIDTSSYLIFGHEFKKYYGGWRAALRGKETSALDAVSKEWRPYFELMEANGEFAAMNRILGETAVDIEKDVGQRGHVLTDRFYTRAMKRINARVEQYHRGALMFDTLRKGGSFDQGFRRVSKFHFNYEDLADWEKWTRDNIIPFWTWTSRNLPLQLETIVRNPRMYQRWNEVKQNFSDDDSELLVPDYLRSTKSVFVNTKIGGQKIDYISPDLPFSSADEVVDKLANLDLSVVGSQLAPPIKTPAELTLGSKFFAGVPLSDKWIPADHATNSLAKIPGVAKVLVAAGKAKRGPNGELLMRERDAYALESFVPIYGRLRRLAPTDPKYDEAVFGSIVSFMGLGLHTVTERDQTNEAYRRADELYKVIDELKQTGVIPAE